jgi:hypothetical protein
MNFLDSMNNKHGIDIVKLDSKPDQIYPEIYINMIWIYLYNI